MLFTTPVQSNTSQPLRSRHGLPAPSTRSEVQAALEAQPRTAPGGWHGSLGGLPGVRVRNSAGNHQMIDLQIWLTVDDDRDHAWPVIMSEAEYTRRHGVSKEAVSKAMAQGRPRASTVVVDGRAKITDPDLADQEWDAATRGGHAPVLVMLPIVDGAPNTRGGRLGPRNVHRRRMVSFAIDSGPMAMILRPGMARTQANANPVRAAIDALAAHISVAAEIAGGAPRKDRRMRLGDDVGDVGELGGVA